MNKGKKRVLLILFSIGFSLYFFGTLITQQGLMDGKNKEYESVLSKIDEENSVKEELLLQNDRMDSDAYIEKVAREKLGMVKRGEKVFVDINK